MVFPSPARWHCFFLIPCCCGRRKCERERERNKNNDDGDGDGMHSMQQRLWCCAYTTIHYYYHIIIKIKWTGPLRFSTPKDSDCGPTLSTAAAAAVAVMRFCTLRGTLTALLPMPRYIFFASTHLLSLFSCLLDCLQSCLLYVFIEYVFV